MIYSNLLIINISAFIHTKIVIFERFLNCLDDEDENVRTCARKCVIETAKNNPNNVIASLVNKLLSDDKIINKVTYSTYLNILNEIITYLPIELLKLASKPLLVFANIVIEALSKSQGKSIPPKTLFFKENSTEIIDFIIGLAKAEPDDIIVLIMKFLDPSTVSESFLINLLQMLNNTYPNLIYVNMAEILPKIVPHLSAIKNDNLKCEYALLLTSLCENFALNIDKPDFKSYFDVLKQMMSSVYDIIISHWITSRDTKLRIASIRLLGYLTDLISQKKLAISLENTTQHFLNFLKKENKNDYLKILEGFNIALENYVKLDPQSLNNMIKSILITMQNILMNPIISPNYPFDPNILKYKNQILKSIQTLGQCYGNEMCEQFFPKFDSKNFTERVCALHIIKLILMKHAEKLSDHNIRNLLGYFKALIKEEDFEIRFVLCEMILMMAMKNVFKKIDDHYFLLQFLLKQVAINEQEIIDKTNLRSDPFETTLEILAKRSYQIYNILCTDKNGFEFIWPSALEFILDPAYSPGLSIILRGIANLIAKFPDDVSQTFSQDIIKLSSKIPRIQSILVRLIIVAHKPFIFKGLGLEIVNSLPIILNALQPEINGISTDDIQTLIKSLTKDSKKTDYYKKLEDLFMSILNCVSISNKTWYEDLNHILFESYSSYDNHAELQGILYKLHCISLLRMEKYETIKSSLEKIFEKSHPEYVKGLINNTISYTEEIKKPIKKGIAKGLGILSIYNFDVVFDFVKSTFNAPLYQKKGGGFFSQLATIVTTSNDDVYLERIRITLLLALGYMLELATRAIIGQKLEAILALISPVIDNPKSPSMKLNLSKIIISISKAVFRLYNDQNDGPIVDEEFKLFFLKQREKIITKLTALANQEKQPDIKYGLYNSLCLISRVDPPLNKEFYNNIMDSILDLIPRAYEEKYQFYFKPLSNLIMTMIYHTEIKSLSTEVIKIITWWEILANILIKLREDVNRRRSPIITIKINDINPSSLTIGSSMATNNLSSIADNNIVVDYQSMMRKMYMDIILNALNNKKVITYRGDRDRGGYLTAIIEIIIWCYYENDDVNFLSKLCLQKVLSGLGCDIEPLPKDLIEFHKNIINALGCKFNMEETVPELVQYILTAQKRAMNNEEFLGLGKFIEAFYILHSKYLKKSQETIIKGFFDSLEDYSTNRPYDNEIRENQIVDNIAKMMTEDVKEIMDILLKKKPEIPLRKSVAKCIKRIMNDKDLILRAFDYLINLLNDIDQSDDINIVIFNATLFIMIMLESNEESLINYCKNSFYQIFIALLLRFGTSFEYINLTNHPFERESSKYALKAMQNFLKCTESKHLLAILDSVPLVKKLISKEYDDGICELIYIMCKNCTMNELMIFYNFILTYVTKKTESQRIIAIIAISQIISCSTITKEFIDDQYQLNFNLNNFMSWINTLVDTLLSNVEHKNDLIRKQCYKGFRNIIHIYNLSNLPKIQKLNDGIAAAGIFSLSKEKILQIIKVLVSGFEESSDACIKESLVTLQKVIEIIQANDLCDVIPMINQKIKRCFIDPDLLNRVGALHLFGQLYSIITNDIELLSEKDTNILREDLHQHIITIILFLNDDNDTVRQAAIFALQKTSALLILPELLSILDSSYETKMIDLFDRTESILADIVFLLASNYANNCPTYISKAIDYIKNNEESIRATAIFIFALFLKLSDIPSYTVSQVEKDEIFHKGFVDKSSKVKMKTLKGYSILSFLPKNSGNNNAV